MARAIVLDYQGEISSLPLGRIDRARLYGSDRRVVVDEDGEPCQVAWLGRDGRTLVPGGGFSMAYVDESGTTVPRSELQTVDADGEVLDVLPSTLGQACELFGPVAPTRVLDHQTKAVYQLQTDGLGGRLAAALERGEIFEAEFRYNAGPLTSTLFLVRNEVGTFALVCQPVECHFLQRTTADDAVEEEDEEDDEPDEDLDFSF